MLVEVMQQPTTMASGSLGATEGFEGTPRPAHCAAGLTPRKSTSSQGVSSVSVWKRLC